MPIVLVPTAYRGPTRGEAEIAVTGETVKDCLEAVEAEYPGFLDQVIDGSGRLHRFVKLFVNQEQLEAPSALATPVGGEDRLEVLAAIAGG